jgi:hypothetical protein
MRAPGPTSRGARLKASMRKGEGFKAKRRRAVRVGEPLPLGGGQATSRDGESSRPPQLRRDAAGRPELIRPPPFTRAFWDRPLGRGNLMSDRLIRIRNGSRSELWNHGQVQLLLLTVLGDGKEGYTLDVI